MAEHKLYGDGSSVNLHPEKLSSHKTLSSMTSQTSAAQFSSSSIKSAYSDSIRKRTKSENPLAQSVPNLSNIRKENTKPLTGGINANNCVKSTIAQNKGMNEETKHVKEERPHRTVKKSSVIPGELQNVFRCGKSKAFLRKGNGVGPGARAGITELKASMASDILKNGEDFERLVNQREVSPDEVRDEEYERTSTENFVGIVFPSDSDTEKQKLSGESVSFLDRRSDNCDVLRSLSEADDDQSTLSSKFNTYIGNMQGSARGNPGLWNSHPPHSSYVQEAT